VGCYGRNEIGESPYLGETNSYLRESQNALATGSEQVLIADAHVENVGVVKKVRAELAVADELADQSEQILPHGIWHRCTLGTKPLSEYSYGLGQLHVLSLELGDLPGELRRVGLDLGEEPVRGLDFGDMVDHCGREVAQRCPHACEPSRFSPRDRRGERMLETIQAATQALASRVYPDDRSLGDAPLGRRLLSSPLLRRNSSSALWHGQDSSQTEDQKGRGDGLVEHRLQRPGFAVGCASS